MSGEIDLSRPVIVGFGVVGRAVARALIDRGFVPVVTEDRPTDSMVAQADELGVEVVPEPSAERLGELVSTASVLLPSPGVPDHHPCFALAQAAGVGVRSEFDLARTWDDRPLVSITGTNGKTTVTMMVTDALNASGKVAAAVGNTEVPLIAAIDDPAVELFVVEASSFRLGHSDRFSPDVATWINFAPDHLDAHASAEAYELAKASIWAHLGPSAVVVANADDPVVMRHVPSGADVVLFSMTDPEAEWHLADGALVGPDGPLLRVSELLRSQPHDLANALAVAATASAGGAEPTAVAEVIRSFAGLPHRLELVGEWDGVSWYNDSKATVPQAAEVAIAGFESVVLIAGGRNKGLSLEGLRATVPPVRHVVAIGDAAAEIRQVFEGLVPVGQAFDMAEAIDAAAKAARAGDVVLLSPGCTSFDWYPNYVERGLDFCRLVRERVGPA
ncbi:MAG: UDP-N-acetylmuramoyl-L-alanine--D-glutamate ligase [Acidimicrobiia bacterium]|nr:UDP-N-acetylmuramoyl-L-alanine--D-glutamate ligase [Acidimicrobiia bacterium]